MSQLVVRETSNDTAITFRRNSQDLTRRIRTMSSINAQSWTVPAAGQARLLLSKLRMVGWQGQARTPKRPFEQVFAVNAVHRLCVMPDGARSVFASHLNTFRTLAEKRIAGIEWLIKGDAALAGEPPLHATRDAAAVEQLDRNPIAGHEADGAVETCSAERKILNDRRLEGTAQFAGRRGFALDTVPPSFRCQIAAPERQISESDDGFSVKL